MEAGPPRPAESDSLPEAFEEISFVNRIFEGGTDVPQPQTQQSPSPFFFFFLPVPRCSMKALEENVHDLGVQGVALPGPFDSARRVLASIWHAIAGFWAAIIPGATFLDRALGPAALLLGTGFTQPP
ncbi:MAG: hypothetical protein R3C29_03040 [Dehalococcoidia bacterium]